MRQLAPSSRSATRFAPSARPVKPRPTPRANPLRRRLPPRPPSLKPRASRACPPRRPPTPRRPRNPTRAAPAPRLTLVAWPKRPPSTSLPSPAPAQVVAWSPATSLPPLPLPYPPLRVVPSTSPWLRPPTARASSPTPISPSAACARPSLAVFWNPRTRYRTSTSRSKSTPLHSWAYAKR